MTKVKTILKEFCSAKDILAINRLGLLSKGEERESQPIPWRHRLKRGERRELVRSEMRMNINRPNTQLTVKDKARALSTAQSPQTSKMGEHLLHEHCKGHSRLDVSLDKLTGAQRRSQHELTHNRRTFLQHSKCLNREPLILVERPPSTEVRTRAAFMNRYGVDPELVSIPSYRRPLLSRARTPSTITTIDSFTVESRRKRNVWEEAADDKADVKFKCTARPSSRLTNHEVKQLKIGHNLHKPTEESIAEAEKRAKEKKRERPKSVGILELEDDFRPSSADSDGVPSVFLTELSKNKSMRPGRGSNIIRAFKSSKSSAAAGKLQSRDPFPPAVPYGLHNKKKVRSRSEQTRSLSAGASDFRSSTISGRSAKKSGGKSSQASKTPRASSGGNEKKQKDFLSVLLEEDD